MRSYSRNSDSCPVSGHRDLTRYTKGFKVCNGKVPRMRVRMTIPASPSAVASLVAAIFRNW